MVALVQPSLSSGEISPKLHARTDLARWQTSLALCRNFIPMPEGGLMNRAGTRFVNASAANDYDPILIPFIFSTEQAYMLELGEGYINVYANGARIYQTNPVAITNVIEEAVGFSYYRTITTGAPHGRTVGEFVQIEGIVATGSYDIDGEWEILQVPDSTHIRIQGSGDPSGAYSSGGTIFELLTIVTPYQREDLEQLRFVQSKDVLTVLHKDYPQHELRRLSATSFTFLQAEYEDGPFLDLNIEESVMVHASARVGEVTLTSTGEIFNPNHVGALFYIEQKNLAEIPPWEPNKKLVGNPASPLNLRRRSDGKTYRCVTDETASSSHEIWTGTVRPTHDEGTLADGDGNALNGGTLVERAGVAWEYRDSGFGILRITAYTSETQVTAQVLQPLPDSVVGGATSPGVSDTFMGDGIEDTFSIPGAVQADTTLWSVTIDGILQPASSFEIDIANEEIIFYAAPGAGFDVVVTEYLHNNRSDVWAFGAWSEDQGYPSVATYWQDRIIFAASRSQPTTVWGSKNGNYPDFGVSVPIVDDDSVTFTLNARQQNAITDLLPLDNLIALTTAGAWKVTDGENQVLTPSTVGFKPQSYRGSQDMRAITVGDVALFAQFGGTKVRTLGYTFETDKFSGRDLSALASHLFTRDKTIRDMDFSEEPYTLLWLVRTDGRLLSLTFNQEQENIGWGRHDTASGYFSRVCAIPENAENAVYFVVRRTINGATRRYIERLAEREVADLVDYVFVDSAISYDGRNRSSATMRVTGSAWTVADTVTLTASSSIFTSSHIGDEVWLHIDVEDLDEIGEPIVVRATQRFRITGFTSPTAVSVNPLSDVSSAFRDIPFTLWTFAHDSFSGAEHLASERCQAIADGEYRGFVDVDYNGNFTIDPPGGVVHLGKQLIADGETLDCNLPGAETVRNRVKSIPKVAFDVYKTRGLMAGPDRDHLEEVAERSQNDYDPGELVTGVLTYRVPSRINTNGKVCFRQDKPLPAMIRAIIPEVEFGTTGG